jgi:hypothetical protein
LFDYAFKSREFPEDWRSVDLAPIFKEGNSTEMNSYPTVSLTNVCYKIMEAVIRDDLIKFFETNKLFNKQQFGFLKG